MNLISRRPRSPTAPSITSAWMGIDVRTEADTPEPPPVVDPDPGDCVNLAAGRPYTSAWAASGSYADDGGQLTDGVYSRALSCKAPEWVRYYNEVTGRL